MTRVPQILVVGGNGFLGSAICKQALSRGWKVTSISQSGKPFVSPAGHQPSWSSSSSISWKKADASNPSTYSHLLNQSDAVVHTLGILLEGDYKGKGKKGSGPVGALLGAWREELGWTDAGNPLKGGEQRKGKYEAVNRDSALTMASAFISSRSSSNSSKSSPFVYISAEDIFRPIIPSRYISTKREAEDGISALASEVQSRSRNDMTPTEEEVPDADGAGLAGEIGGEEKNFGIRPIFVRPGLMYHPHTRPLSTLPAAFFDLTSNLQSYHRKSKLPFPTASEILQRFSLESMGNLLKLSPLHVDTVAKAVCESIVREEVMGPVDTRAIKRLSGFKEDTEESWEEPRVV